MNIAIIGGTGLIGVALSKRLKERGDNLLLISRDSNSAKNKNVFADIYLNWDYKTSGKLAEQLINYKAVINLAGAPISGKRWNNNYKNTIRNSRTVTTRLIAEEICKCKIKPNVFISSSAAGYYGDNGETMLTEDSPMGIDFLAGVCAEWENASKKVLGNKVRLVNIRTGIVLSKEGGALKKILLPYKLFLGGPLAGGTQWFPWIHIEDEVNAIIFSIDNNKINGALNLTAPNSVRMNDFSKTLGKVLKRLSVFRVPKLALRIVAGEIADNLVLSQRVYPKKLLDNGYKFKFAKIDKALLDLLG